MGEPKTKGRSEWRYGRKGSLKIGLPGTDGGGSWYCFESGTSGGVLALIEREADLSPENKHAAAVKWLRDRGLIPAAAERPAQRSPANSHAAANPEPQPRRKASPTSPPVPPNEIWSAGEHLTPDTPAWLYLAGRLVWPPTNSIFPDLPPSVRWLPLSGDRTPPYFRRALPASAGVVLYAFHRWVDGERGPLAAVSMEAVRADGKRCDPRWRRTFGPRTGALFDAGLSDDSRPRSHRARGGRGVGAGGPLAVSRPSRHGHRRVIRAGPGSPRTCCREAYPRSRSTWTAIRLGIAAD